MDKFRCFLAIKIPEIDIGPHIKAIRGYDARISIVNPERYHLTLHFIGDTDQFMMERIVDKLQDLDFAPFDMRIENPGKIPPKSRKARVLYIGISRGRDQLITLVEQVRKKLRELDLTIPGISYLPHLTVARIRSGREVASVTEKWMNQTIRHTDIKVDEILLLRSTLTSSGPKYEKIASFTANIE